MTSEKDLGVKIGSEAQVYWQRVKTQSETAIKNNKYEITINERILQLANEKIVKEKEMFK